MIKRLAVLAALVLVMLLLSILFSATQQASASHHNLTDSLVAYWHLDEASGTRADEINGYDLTDNNTTGSTTGKINDAADFIEPNNEYLSIADNADLSGADIDFTVAAWVWLDDIPTQSWIINKFVLGDREYRLRALSGSPDHFEALFSEDGTNFDTVDSGSISTDQWYYVIMWHSATSNTIGIRVNNGTTITTTHAGGIYNGTQDLRFSTSGSTMDGRLDEVAIWRRLLTDAEQDLLWNGGDGLDILEEPTPTPTITNTPAPTGTPTPSSIYTHTLDSDHQLVVDLSADFGETFLSGVLLTLLTIFVVSVLVRSRP